MSRITLFAVIAVASVFCFASACNPLSEADDVTIPTIEPKLVLNAYLIPQNDVQKIFVATSLPLNYDLTDYYKSLSGYTEVWRLSERGVIPNATVHFTDLDNNVTITPTFDKKMLTYNFAKTDMAIREGGQYEVSVEYKDYPSIRERFVVPVCTKPEVDCADEGVASLVRIHAEKEPARYFYIHMLLRPKEAQDPPTHPQEFTYFVSSATSINGAITVRRRTVSVFDQLFNESRYELYSVHLFELDERTYLYFTALERNMQVQNNPFATPSLLRNYVENGFGIAAGVIDHGEILP